MKPRMGDDLVDGGSRLIRPILTGTEAEQLDPALDADILVIYGTDESVPLKGA